MRTIGKACAYNFSVLAASISLIANAQEQLMLEEIVVTAQKREQSLQDVPASVSVMSGDSIRDYVGSAENIRALAGRVPSLQVESSNGRQSPRFYIRGLGNIDFDVNASQPVSMILDDIALENSVLKSLPLFDVDRIEVLKGPQGTLFGRNTPAGIVKIDTVKPTSDTTAYATAGYGSRETWFFEGAIGGPLGETVASRLSVKYLDRGAWIDNTVNGGGDDFGGFDEFAYRLQFLFDPTDSLQALVKLHGFHQNGDQPQIFYGNALAQGREGTRSGFDEETVSQDNVSSGFELDHIGASANISYEFNDLTFTSITGYDTVESFSRADIDGGLATFDPAEFATLGRNAFGNVESGDGLDDHYQFSQEFRISGETDELFYQVGLFYFDEDITVNSTDYHNGPPPTFMPELDRTTFVEQQTTSLAVFGQVEYSFTDVFSVTAGLRYTDDDKDLDVVPGLNSLAPASTISTGDQYVSWDLAFNYDINDDWSVYGRVGAASRGPITIGRFGFTSQADTETLTSGELGFKSQLFDGAARWNATIYTYEIEDQQLFATGGVANINTALNADKTTGAGFETDFEWLVTENFRLMANLSYNDTEIEDDVVSVQQCASTPSCTGKDPVVSFNPDGFFGPETRVSIDGNPLPRSPEWLYNVSLSYTVPLQAGKIYFNTDWNYRSESNIFLYETVEHIAEERWLGGVRIGYKSESENLDVAVVGRNITDEVVVDGAIDFLNLTAFVSEPAFWGVEARYNF